MKCLLGVQNNVVPLVWTPVFFSVLSYRYRCTLMTGSFPFRGQIRCELENKPTCTSGRGAQLIVIIFLKSDLMIRLIHLRSFWKFAKVLYVVINQVCFKKMFCVDLCFRRSLLYSRLKQSSRYLHCTSEDEELGLSTALFDSYRNHLHIGGGPFAMATHFQEMVVQRLIVVHVFLDCMFFSSYVFCPGQLLPFGDLLPFMIYLISGLNVLHVQWVAFWQFRTKSGKIGGYIQAFIRSIWRHLPII